MTNHNVEELFTQLDQSCQCLKEALDLSDLEAYVENGENILDQAKTRVIDGRPDEETAAKLNQIYADLNLESYSPEEIRKASQLLILKAMKEDYVQANHMMTPDVCGLIVAHLLYLFHSDAKSLDLLDLGVGTGNFLTSVLNHLQTLGLTCRAYGVDVDDLLLSVAIVHSALQGHRHIQFYKQDALSHLLIDPVDVVLSDLPVGYYPNDEGARAFHLSAQEGHSYAHFLFIEQAMNYMKPGAFGFFLLPSRIFSSDESKSLIQYIYEHGHFQALIQLPAHFFKDEEAQQSILMIQKKGPNTKQAREVLMAQAPPMDHKESLLRFLDELDIWKSQNFN